MLAILNLPRQIWRGATNLPHVGRHPGSDFFVIMVAITALAGGHAGGVSGFAMGIAFGLTLYGTFYAFGAVDRARTSDRMVRRERLTELFDAWLGTLDAPPEKGVALQMVMRDSEHGQRLVASIYSTAPIPEIPESLRAGLERVLTQPAHGSRIRHRPRSEDLRTITTMTREMSAHEKIEAIATLAALGKHSA